MREELSDYRMNAEKYLKQVEKDSELLKRLNEQYRAGKVTRLEALQLDLAWQLGKMSGTLHQSFDSYLKEVAKYAYRKIAGGNSQSTLNKPALEQIVKTPFNGKNYSDSIWGNTDDLAKDLKKFLPKGLYVARVPQIWLVNYEKRTMWLKVEQKQSFGQMGRMLSIFPQLSVLKNLD